MKLPVNGFEFWGIPIMTRKHRFEYFIHVISLNLKSVLRNIMILLWTCTSIKHIDLKTNVIAHA